MALTGLFRGARGGVAWRLGALAPVLGGMLLGGMLSGACPDALAQPGDGQIFIAGPGDRSGADAAQMGTLLAASASPAKIAVPNTAALALPADTTREVDADSVRNGMITIPGPGEPRGASAAAADALRIVTIPAPGTAAAGASMPAAATRNVAPALQRVSVGGTASRIAPIVVDTAANTPDGASSQAITEANARANAVQRYAEAAARANARTTAQPDARATAQPNAYAIAPTSTAPVPPGQQDGESIRAAALAYLQQQSAGLPGHITITVSPVFPRGLAACASLDPFTPPGARMWGRTTVGVRCVGAKPWTLYVGARVSVDITYYVAARQIGPGDTLTMADLTPREGDLASLPTTVITDPSQAADAVALVRIAAGLPLRTDVLRSAAAVVIGQTVKLVAIGPNFTISAEGSVLNNAAPGQQVRVRTAGGQIVTGVVRDAGTVQVQI